MTDTMPGRRIEYLPLDELVPNPVNPKRHDVGGIDRSLDQFGVIDPIVRDDRTGQLISGHGRTETLSVRRDRGESPPDGVTLGPDGRWLVPVVVGWGSRSDADASAALVALNNLTTRGGWDERALIDLLESLAGVDDGALLAVTGFGLEDMEALSDALDNEDEARPPTGERLALIEVAVGEPVHQCHRGQVWTLGRHLLVVARLLDEHDLWAPLLPGRSFVPYPEMTITCSMLALERDLLLVQPNLYLAGHTIDVYAKAFPDEPCHP